MLFVPSVNTPLEIPGYGLANARFGLAGIKVGADSGSVDLMLFGQNLTDKSYWSAVGSGYLGYGKPRTVKFTGKIDF